MKPRYCIAIFLCAAIPLLAHANCPPKPLSMLQWRALEASQFVFEDKVQLQELAIDLLDCLASPDPYWRDAIAYTGLSLWLRGDQIDKSTLQTLRKRTQAILKAPADPQGFVHPFAAIVLSEIARTDRVKQQFNDKQFVSMVDSAEKFMREIRDYRGFDEQSGWRHSVAHGSDLVLQLILNPRIDQTQKEKLMDALAALIAPSGVVYFRHGEAERLARTVFYSHYATDIADADKAENKFWVEWFERLIQSDSKTPWRDAFKSEAGLARRHNTLSFLYALHFMASASPALHAQHLARLSEQAVQQINGG